MLTASPAPRDDNKNKYMSYLVFFFPVNFLLLGFGGFGRLVSGLVLAAYLFIKFHFLPQPSIQQQIEYVWCF